MQLEHTPLVLWLTILGSTLYMEASSLWQLKPYRCV